MRITDFNIYLILVPGAIKDKRGISFGVYNFRGTGIFRGAGIFPRNTHLAEDIFTFDNCLQLLVITADFYFPLVILVIDGIGQSVILVKCCGIQGGDSVTSAKDQTGVYISDAKTAVAYGGLDGQSPAKVMVNKEIFTYANGNIYLLDKSGRKYLPVSAPEANPPENTYYFQAGVKDDLQVVIPFILLHDNQENREGQGQKINLKLTVPDQGENSQVKIPVKIGDYTVNIVKLQRTANEDKIIFRRITLTNADYLCNMYLYELHL